MMDERQKSDGRDQPLEVRGRRQKLLHQTSIEVYPPLEGDLIEILRKIFESESGKSTIELREKCSDCGCEFILAITRTSGGFGLNGGSLVKGSADTYMAECENCYKSNQKLKIKERMRHPSNLKQSVLPT